jgi:hypothetical protein
MNCSLIEVEVAGWLYVLWGLCPTISLLLFARAEEKNMKKIVWAIVAMIIGLVTAQAAGFKVEIVPSFGPVQSSPSFNAYAMAGVAALKDGTGVFPFTVRSGPTDVKGLTYVGPEDFMSSSVAFYRGAFSPVAPWNSEKGGTVWWWLRVTATDEGTVSLADVVVKLSSFSDNSLGKDTTFTSSSYTPTAIGITAGSQTISSGSASQQCKMVIVAVGSKSFPVASLSDVQVVQNYLAQFGNAWNTTCSVTVGTTTVTKVLGVVPPSTTAIPKLAITRSPSVTSLVVESNGNPALFVLQATATLGSAWIDSGTVSAGQSMTLVSSSGNKFYRLKP